jgi:hypothetical protein
MLVWLASYPRSGNTLLRTILHRAFSVAAPSIYPEGSTTGEHDWGDLIPRFAVPTGLDSVAFADWARAHEELQVVKTHQMPDGRDDPAIVVIRDARAAMVSYERYTMNFSETPSELEEIVIGASPLMNWTEWNREWTTRSAPTLVLRYEQVARDPGSAIASLEAFLGVPMQRPFDLTFGDVKSINPKLFAVGHDRFGIAEMERRCPNLFWTAHGEAMRQFGYGADDARTIDQSVVLAALAEAGRAIRQAKRAIERTF